MPEGDSVHRLAARLSSLAGRKVTRWDMRVPRLATTDLVGWAIDTVEALGKNLYWHLSSEDNAAVFFTHLRMDGTWLVRPAATAPAPSHRTRVLIRVEGVPDPVREVELQGVDLGMVDLWPASEHARRIEHLGPDPLGPSWEQDPRWQGTGPEEAVRRVCADADRPLAEAFLDQRNIAGVGNEYVNELCFLLGHHPLAPASVVDIPHAVERVAALMQENLPRSQRTFTGVDRDGERTFVFGRRGQPCRRCGTRIEQGTTTRATSVADPRVGQERITWWCPVCQPGP